MFSKKNQLDGGLLHLLLMGYVKHVNVGPVKSTTVLLNQLHVKEVGGVQPRRTYPD